MLIILHEVGIVHQFVRGLTFSVRSYVFRAAIEEASFQSIRTAKDVEVIVLEEFGDPKRDHSSVKFSGASSRSSGSLRGSSSFQRRGLVHASMPAAESEQLTQGSYVSCRGSHGSSSSSQH
ncbi:hypothetical protein R3W88_031837 [Solanum pinnatisectum]|uniref:Uncharacterized protein n=1 Tax=Solanum pinnatisectum TaxID=50273 RepID=A0AAV9LR50_9SOLN|nr:hypothetical protein R3W88_031837 [Solanum pinnatisectum]